MFGARIRRKKIFGFLSTSDRSLHKPDYFLLVVIGLITIFGLVMLSSASSVRSFNDFGSTYHYFLRQVIRGFIPGVLALFVLSKVRYQFWEKFSVWFFIASMLLLTLVFVPGLGVKIGGAQSWLNFGGIVFQPAEVVKLFLIMSLAGWFAYRGQEKTVDFWNGLIPFLVVLILIASPIILQPDTGTLGVVIMIALAVYFAAGAKLSHLFSLGIAGLGVFGLMVAVAPYRIARLTTFLHPEFDPSGAGYHINQALLAVGSGGLFGLGFGQSRQKFAYLPEVMGDSIFAIIAEELGFIFTFILVVLFILLALRGLRLAKRSEDDYARLLVIGIVCWFAVQAFFNIGAMLGLLPITGIPLPFISYGGTALAANLAAAGILINISRQVRLD